MSRPSFTSSMNHLGALALQNNWKIQILWLSDKQTGHSCWLCYPLTVNEILPYICTATALSFGSCTSKKFWNFMFAKPRIYVCICVATWVKCACQPMIWTIAVNVFAQFERLFFFIFFYFCKCSDLNFEQTLRKRSQILQTLPHTLCSGVTEVYSCSIFIEWLFYPLL